MCLRFHYKKPGAWLWQLRTTEDLAAEIAGGQILRDGRFRLENTAVDIPLGQLLHVQSVKQGVSQSTRVATQAADEGFLYRFGAGFLVGGMSLFLGVFTESGTGWFEALMVGAVGGSVIGIVAVCCTERGFELFLDLISF